jgi:hypothetical protein
MMSASGNNACNASVIVRLGDDVEGGRLFANLFADKRPEPRHDLRLSGLGEDVANPERLVV